MHILFLSDNFPPEVNPGASRTYEHSREWVNAGHRVTVVTSQPNSPKGRVFDGYRNQLYQVEQVDGIRVVRVWTYMTRNEGVTKRILDFMSFMVTSFLAAIWVRRVDVIVVTSPNFFAVWTARAIALLKRRSYVFDVRDIWPESIRAVGAMRPSRALLLLEKVELYLYRKAAAVTVVTHAFKRNLISRGIAHDKIHVVTNGVDLSKIRPRPKDAALEDELGLKGKFVAGYIGTHGMAHGLETLLDAAAILRCHPNGDRYRILMLGDGAERAMLKEQARSCNLDNVIFLETVLKTEVGRYWSLLDVSIIPLRRSPLFLTVIPSKLFECMALGLPVLHGVEGESADIVTSNDVGLTVEPENAEALAAGIMSLERDELLRARLATNGPVAAKKYDRKVLAIQMLRVIEDCARPA